VLGLRCLLESWPWQQELEQQPFVQLRLAQPVRLVVVEQLRLKQPIQPLVVAVHLAGPQQAKPELIHLTSGLEPEPRLALGLQPFALESNRPTQLQKRCLQSTLQ